MLKKLNLLLKSKKGTWIRNLSMFLCAILLMESMFIPVCADAATKAADFGSEVISQTEPDAEWQTAVSGNNAVDTYISPGESSVSENDCEEEFVLSQTRYDFCEIDYSVYANENADEKVLAPAYLSSVYEVLDRSGITVDNELYDPYVSNLDTVTAVRNQGSTDTCWAFATTAAAELSSIKQGIAGHDQWFAPYHMAYFLYHHVTDPLGGTEGDTNIAVTSKNPDFLQAGGNLFMALFQMANWSGVVMEEKAPFDESVNQGTVLSDSFAYDADALLKNGYMLSTDTNQVQDMKQAVVDYGGVAIQFHAGSQYKNATTGAYYCNASGTNHAAVIVGWDDNYSVENFREDCRPVSNGAWIVKNSWGSSQGREGYNYISYEDASIAFPMAMELMPANTYDNNYHYDGSLAVTDTSVVAVESGGSVANIFTAHASEDRYDENLEAVSIALKSTDVSYKISIYKHLKADEEGVLNPSSGKLMLTQEGKTGRAGIYTIPLEQSIPLSAGDTFSVVFTLQSEDGTSIETWMEKDYDYGWVTGTANIQKGQSFRKLTSKHTWFDLYYTNDTKPYRGLARIKAFTNTLTTISSKDINDYVIAVSENSFVADGTPKCPEVTILKGTEWLSPGTEYEVEYQNNVEAGDGQVVVRGIGEYTGTVTIPIYLYAYSIEDCTAHEFNDTKCVKCGYPLKEQKLTGTESYTKNYLDAPFKLEVVGNATAMYYQSDNEAVATVDAKGIVTIKGVGVANILATAVKSDEYQKTQLKIQIQVQHAQISEAQLVNNKYYYDGTAKTPAVKVLDQKKNSLTQNKDYTVQYSNNKEVGTASVLITGMGNYTGIIKQVFVISSIPQEQCSHEYANGTCRFCGYTRKVQTLTGTLFYEQYFSNKNFWLDMKTDGDGALTYESDDPSVVTVDEHGYVTVHGTGIAYIHVKAAQTSLYYANTAQILVEILPAKSSISVPDTNIKKTYGSKAFTLKVTTTSNGKITYKSSNKKVATISSKGKVTVKGYGKATLTITTAETDQYEKGTKKITLTIVPKKLSLTKVKASGNGKVCLTCKKNKTVDGYQIQYSTSKNFKKSVKTKKISNYKTTSIILSLTKKKTYYFRVRSYKKVGKNTYYGAYSTVKKVKVK